MNMVNYGLRKKYEEISMFGDRLAEMEKLVDWEVFRTMLADLYRNNTELGGRPNSDPVLTVKVLFLRSLYDLVDEAMWKEIHDNDQTGKGKGDVHVPWIQSHGPSYPEEQSKVE